VIEVFLIITLSLIFAIVLRRVVQVKLDPSESVLALHANAMADAIDNSSKVADRKIDLHINNLMKQVKDSIKNEQYTFAEKVLVRIATLDPQNFETYKILGDLYLKQQNFKDAISAYKFAIRIQPKDAFVMHNLGLAYYQINQFRKSIFFIKKSIKIEPEVAHRYVSLSAAYQGIKDVKSARFYMEKAIDLEPANIAYQKLHKEIN
jgi:tetratricopeptide (TPR) repeat protein